MCMKCVATSSLAQMTSLGAGKRASASLEKGFPGVSVLEFQTDDSNARIYTHGSGENAPKSGPPKGN